MPAGMENVAVHTRTFSYPTRSFVSFPPCYEVFLNFILHLPIPTLSYTKCPCHLARFTEYPVPKPPKTSGAPPATCAALPEISVAQPDFRWHKKNPVLRMQIPTLLAHRQFGPAAPGLGNRIKNSALWVVGQGHETKK